MESLRISPAAANLAGALCLIAASAGHLDPRVSTSEGLIPHWRMERSEAIAASDVVPGAGPFKLFFALMGLGAFAAALPLSQAAERRELERAYLEDAELERRDIERAARSEELAIAAAERVRAQSAVLGLLAEAEAEQQYRDRLGLPPAAMSPTASAASALPERVSDIPQPGNASVPASAASAVSEPVSAIAPSKNASVSQHPTASAASALPERILDISQAENDSADSSVYSWVNSLIGYPSVLIWGPSGAGKTTFAAWLLRQRIERGHEALILDPHRAAGQWEGLPCIGDGMNYAAIDAALEGFRAEIQDLYLQRSQRADFAPKPKTVLVDEFTNWASHCEQSGEFFAACLSDIRKIQRYALFIAHDRTLQALGGGSGLAKARDNGLLELELQAIDDPRTGEARPAMRGRLKRPGQPIIEVAIAPWMKSSFDFRPKAPAPSPDLADRLAALEAAIARIATPA